METFIKIQINDAISATDVFADLLINVPFVTPIVAMIDDDENQIRLHIRAEEFKQTLKNIKAHINEIADCKVSILRVDFEIDIQTECELK